MKLLLDTHAFLFFINGDKFLPSKCKGLIEDPLNDVFLSKASLWEIAIKHNVGKLELRNGFSDVILQVQKNAFSIMEIENPDLVIFNKLPLHHRDPFDRMIIAQAIAFKERESSLSIITRDKNFDLYDVITIW